MRVLLCQDGEEMRLCELEDKEVINACGCIEALVVPKAGKLCGFFCDGSEYIIPFKCIRKIGADIILVEIHEER